MNAMARYDRIKLDADKIIGHYTNVLTSHVNRQVQRYGYICKNVSVAPGKSRDHFSMVPSVELTAPDGTIQKVKCPAFEMNLSELLQNDGARKLLLATCPASNAEQTQLLLAPAGSGGLSFAQAVALAWNEGTLKKETAQISGEDVASFLQNLPHDNVEVATYCLATLCAADSQFQGVNHIINALRAPDLQAA